MQNVFPNKTNKIYIAQMITKKNWLTKNYGLLNTIIICIAMPSPIYKNTFWIFF